MPYSVTRNEAINELRNKIQGALSSETKFLKKKEFVSAALARVTANTLQDCLSMLTRRPL